MHSRKLLVYSLFFLSFKLKYIQPLLSSSETTQSFVLDSFTHRNLTLLGDSSIRHGIVGLTKEVGVPYPSSGSVIYKHPIAFFDPHSNTTASFFTTFTFTAGNDMSPPPYGDGLTFFLSPDNLTLGSPGGYLGLVNSSQLTKNKFIAIEFDTKLDSLFTDPNDNHVGLDIDSLVSIKTADADSMGVDFKDGELVTAWIYYKNEEKKLEVYLSEDGVKPEEPLLKVDIDLSDYLKEFMYVGFSASTEESNQPHAIERWSFQILGNIQN